MIPVINLGWYGRNGPGSRNDVSRLVGSLRSEQHPILNTSEAYAIVANRVRSQKVETKKGVLVKIAELAEAKHLR
jgi:hypothetical protein